MKIRRIPKDATPELGEAAALYIATGSIEEIPRILAQPGMVLREAGLAVEDGAPIELRVPNRAGAPGDSQEKGSLFPDPQDYLTNGYDYVIMICEAGGSFFMQLIVLVTPEPE